MQSTKIRKTVLSLVAAGLLSATAITASIAVQAETGFATIDPTKGFAPLVEHVMPAVVSVEVKFQPAAADEAAPEVPEQFKEFFEQFPQFRDRFPGGPQRRGPGGAQGSGFVISADGYVVTNNHVVDNASEVTLRFQSGDEYTATVVGTDAKTDIALLKIKSEKSFPFVKFDDEEAKVGDWVMAVGNPFGLGGSVTTGIISARGRDIGSGPYDDFLQVDASINKGNSGGPTFDLEGEVVGVNTAIYSPSGGSVGIGFAIPAKLVQDVVKSLKDDGAVTRGWLGVRIQGVTEDLAEGLGLAKAEGAIINDLTENSPAQNSGLKQGDTILTVSGEPINDARELSRIIAKVKPGASVPVEIFRDGKRQTVDVKIGVMPSDTPKMASAKPEAKEEKGLDLSDFGLNVAPADDGAGVKITEIDPKSPAAMRGLQKGDVILQVGGTDVSSPGDIKTALKGEKSKQVIMLIKSGEQQRFVALPREKS